MRIPTSKIYRAFPEFDRFDDATCERYIRAMSSVPGRFLRRWTERVLWSIAHVVTVLVGFVAVGIAIAKLFGVSSTVSDSLVLLVSAVSMFLACTGGPLLVLVLRDVVLRRRIAAQLTLTKCPACRYNLLGVPLTDSLPTDEANHAEGPSAGIICPECGFVTRLADIAPETADAIRRAADASHPSNMPRTHPPTEPERPLTVASSTRGS
jgi:hypothetical protein